MSEKILKKGDKVKIFLSNNFNFSGKVLAVDDKFIKILDFKTNEEKIFPLNSVTDINLLEDKDE